MYKVARMRAKTQDTNEYELKPTNRPIHTHTHAFILSQNTMTNIVFIYTQERPFCNL